MNFNGSFQDHHILLKEPDLLHFFAHNPYTIPLLNNNIQQLKYTFIIVTTQGMHVRSC